jgi:hypothetical protein
MTKTIIAVLSLMASTAAWAWDGAVSGTINGIDVTDGAYAFRIDLVGAPALCGNTNTWAFVDVNNPDYKTYVALLLSAHAAGRSVLVYTTREASGYCRIGYVRMR